MSNELTLFNFEENEDNFENYSHENGITYWWATDLMKMLGYKNWTSFRNKIISKAMTTCTTLGISTIDLFRQELHVIDGNTIHDFKLSREACFLIAMNGDNKILQVAKAQMYFTSLAGAVIDYIEEANKVERINVRSEVSERETSLSMEVHKREPGIDYGLFQNAGYRGMYNKNISDLKKARNIPLKGKSLLDYMGKDELAANLFRLSQTEIKITQEDITGQNNLESAAFTVGEEVRKTIIAINKIHPEEFPALEHIKETKKLVKGHTKNLKQIDIKRRVPDIENKELTPFEKNLMDLYNAGYEFEAGVTTCINDSHDSELWVNKNGSTVEVCFICQTTNPS